MIIDTWLKELNIPLNERISMVYWIVELNHPQQLPPHKLCGIEIYKIPLLNIFYETFFDETPSISSIESMLELFGLMSALLFSVVISNATVYGYDDYKAAIERWTEGEYSDCWIDGYGQWCIYITNPLYINATLNNRSN